MEVIFPSAIWTCPPNDCSHFATAASSRPAGAAAAWDIITGGAVAT
jgi:hypothetical protein